MVGKIGHIGIVGCSAEGAALCYRTVCLEGAGSLGPYAHPEISLHTPSFAHYVAALAENDMAKVGDLMLDSAHRLASAGADFLICPDNTIHQALDYVRSKSPLPWLSIADVVASTAKARGFQRPAILGTRWLVDSDVYPAALEAQGLQWMRPDAPARDRINQIIMEELVNGQQTESGRACFQEVIAAMKDSGCDAAILGCTEIPLIIDDDTSSLPTLDSTRLLARAALTRAVNMPAE